MASGGSGGSGLRRYLLTRLALAPLFLLTLLTAVFVLVRVMPGDPVVASLGGRATPDRIERAQEARREAERALETGYTEGADLSAARAALQQALMRIRVAERRHREGPRHRG